MNFTQEAIYTKAVYAVTAEIMASNGAIELKLEKLTLITCVLSRAAEDGEQRCNDVDYLPSRTSSVEKLIELELI